MTRSEFKSQARLFRTRNPQLPEFDAKGKLNTSQTETCRDVLFVRSIQHGHATYYRKRDRHEVSCRSALVFMLCLGNASKETIRSRTGLLDMAEFRGALPLPA